MYMATRQCLSMYTCAIIAPGLAIAVLLTDAKAADVRYPLPDHFPRFSTDNNIHTLSSADDGSELQDLQSHGNCKSAKTASKAAAAVPHYLQASLDQHGRNSPAIGALTKCRV